MDSEGVDTKVEMMAVDVKKKRLRNIVVQTIIFGLPLFLQGAMVSMKGPAFADLQLISGTDVEGGSAFFTASAFGYLMGSVVAGILYDRLRLKSLLIVIPIIMASLTYALTPWCAIFMLMLIMHAFNSFFCGIFETTSNTEVLRLWDGNSDSAMQFLSFTYSLGGIVGPLIAESFLTSYFDSLNTQSNASSPHLAISTNGDSSYHIPGSSAVNQSSSSSSSLLLFTTLDLHNLSAINSSDLSTTNGSRGNSDILQKPQSRIHYAYLIASLVGCVIAIPFFVMCCKSRSQGKKANSAEDETTHKRKLPLKAYIFLTGLISALIFFYTAVDEMFSQYLSIFVVTFLDWSNEAGAIVSSLYWGSSTIIKLAMVFLVRRVRTSVVLLVSTIGTALSLLLFTLCSQYHITIMIWIATASLALMQSSVLGASMAWTDTNLIVFDGKVTSCCMIFASLGAMLNPMLLGYLMKEISLMSFPYVLLIQAFLIVLLFIFMLVVVKPTVTRKYGPPRPENCKMHANGQTVSDKVDDSSEAGEVEEEGDSDKAVDKEPETSPMI